MILDRAGAAAVDRNYGGPEPAPDRPGDLTRPPRNGLPPALPARTPGPSPFSCRFALVSATLYATRRPSSKKNHPGWSPMLPHVRVGLCNSPRYAAHCRSAARYEDRSGCAGQDLQIEKIGPTASITRRAVFGRSTMSFNRQ